MALHKATFFYAVALLRCALHNRHLSKVVVAGQKLNWTNQTWQKGGLYSWYYATTLSRPKRREYTAAFFAEALYLWLCFAASFTTKKTIQSNPVQIYSTTPVPTQCKSSGRIFLHGDGKRKNPISSLEMGFLVAALGIEPKSRASETLILSVVRRGRIGLQK